MKAKTPYLEALRYMANSKETLKKAGKKDTQCNVSGCRFSKYSLWSDFN